MKMEPESTTQNCQTCLRPVNEAGSHPITQWQSFCKCDRTYSPNAQFSIDVCATCKKRVVSHSAGRVDRLYLCSCETPNPKSIPSFQKQKNQEEPVTLDLVSMGLDPESFPQERYSPIAILGQSDRADVILARDKQSGKKVAVKRFKQIKAEAFTSFEQDAKKNKQLSHNNIARVLESFIYSQAPLMVSEYKDGFNLEQNLAIHGIPSHDVAVMILISICEALIYAQKESLLHRDLRPGNVIFLDDMNSDPSISITDFSLPKIKANEQFSESGDARYLSAEEARGLEYDERSEVYSIGSLGFALLTGRPPFQDGTARDIKNAHALKLPPRISDLNFQTGRPKDLEEVIERCLEKDPRVRFDSVAKLLERLEVFPRREKMQIAAVLAAKQRKKLLTILAAVVAVLVFSAIGYFAINKH
jgi:eukaryotic-like serine/threonine-protein kinase